MNEALQLRNDAPAQVAEIVLNGVRPLSTAPRGQTVHVVRIAEGCRAKQRLSELGITPGVEIKIVQDDGSSFLLAVRGSRLAVGRCLAHTILVNSY